MYGPAPTAEKNRRTRLDDLFDDVNSKKKIELESKGLGIAHSLIDDDYDLLDGATFTNSLNLENSEPGTFSQTINEYFT